jgi:uncharacterized membrane protein
MIEAHTLDAWTRVSDRSSTLFRDAMVLAGFAAPLFLWLAGITLVLSADSARRRGRTRREAADAVCRRGLEIFVLAFLFRLQAFFVSPGAHPVTLFRVDILNIMGPAIVAAGLVVLVAETRVVAFAMFALTATAVALLTPLVWTATSVNRLPIWVQWYIRPSGDNTTFTGFPWMGFVFAGAAAGVLLAAGRAKAEPRTHLRLALAGGLLTLLGFYTASRPSIYHESSFWTTSPSYFAVRVGVLMVALAVVYFVERSTATWRLTLSPLARLGRQSLFVYWIHVELVYGYATWAIRKRLPFWGAVAAYALFAAAMYFAVVLRDLVVDKWRGRSRQMSLQSKAETA